MTSDQLRNSILQEAISGRLVPQDPNDEPASILLQRIREEKERLAKEGKLKKKDLVETPITDDEKPFEIPDNWEWVRLGEITSYRRGSFPQPYTDLTSYGGENSMPFVQVADVDENFYRLKKKTKKTISQKAMPFSVFVPIGTVVVTLQGSIGKVAITQYDSYVDRTLAIFNQIYGQINKMFFSIVLKNKFENEALHARGATIKTITKEEFQSFILPLPPLAEQKRIVAKLEELLPIVEQYGKAQTELDELNAALPARLRQSILQEAIHGKLVPQDEKEGTAEELLKLIDAEKQRLVKERILKKAIRTSAIIPEDSPFEIPTSWLWANLEDVTYAVGGRENQILSKEILKEGKIRVVSQGQAIYDGYCNDATKEINDLPVILFGDHTRNVKYIDFPFVIGADGTKLFRPIGIYPRYLYYWMKYAASTLRNRGYARHYTLLKVVPVPLPPLAEQQRIVAKIEELFEQIDKISK